MDIQPNKLKEAFKTGNVVYGLWNALVDGVAGEILAGAGFDWVLIDGEHAPFDLRSILQQLQVMAAYNIPVAVRPASGDPVLVKQLADIGVQSLVIPMVETAEEATSSFQAMQYPPVGIRGIGTGMARASMWNNIEDYVHVANREMCLIVMVETVKGIEQLDNILQVAGVDGVFIGPADLAASMGFVGESDHPEVRAEIERAIKKIRLAGKAAGIMALTKELAEQYRNYGANMIAVGVDTLMLAAAAKKLFGEFMS